MAAPAFRIWFGDHGATEDELRRVELIEVTQEMDAFWEARVQMILCLDANGAWQHWPGESAEPFSRVRIELDPGSGSFVPLIDGPLVSIDAALDALPGRSTATMVIRDDSAFLNRDEEVEAPFERRTDSEIARELFERFEQIDSTRIEGTNATPEATTRRGTVLQFLREIGRTSDRHVYVLPGDERGASIGCFLPDPQDAAEFAPLILIGDDRNLANATVTQDPDGAEITQAQVLRVDDQGFTTFESSADDLGLMRDLPAIPADLTPRRLIPPADNTREDPAAAAQAQARRNAYAFKLSGELVPGCYAQALTPYQKVRLDAGATPYSGDYLITQVVHRITPSLYSQTIEAKSDSVAEVSGAAVAQALGGGLKLSVSASGAIL